MLSVVVPLSATAGQDAEDALGRLAPQPSVHSPSEAAETDPDLCQS